MTKNKGIAVVTGASAGIGKAYADRLAGRGYDLILVARRADRLATIAADLGSRYGVAVETIVADLGLAADLDRVAERLSTDDHITLLVNNAGTATMGPAAQASAAQLDAMTNVNVTALARLTLAVLPRFKALDHGTIINIGSVLGFESLPVSAIYSGGKGYVHNFTRAVQAELANSKVVIQLVLPAATATEIWDLGGVPLSALDPAVVMSVDDLVDAAFKGLDLGEKVTLPSVENAEELLAAYDAARRTLLGAAQNGKPASRYRA